MIEIKYRRDLWKLIENVHGNIAEIGVAEGNFSEDMLKWPIKPRKVYMVDRWKSVRSQKGDAAHSQHWHDKNLATVLARTAIYGSRAIVLRGDSIVVCNQVPDKSLALVYIDGDHSYRGVMDDIWAWGQKVIDGGVMAFHDYEAPQYGVKRAVQDFCKPRGIKVHLLPEDKIEDAGAYFLC